MKRTAHLVGACLGLCALMAVGGGAFASSLEMEGNGCSIMNSSGTTYNPTINGRSIVNNSTSTLYSLCSLPVDDWGQVYTQMYVNGGTQGYPFTPAAWAWIPDGTGGYTAYPASCSGGGSWASWSCGWSGLYIVGSFSVKSTLGRGAYHTVTVAN